MNTWIVGEPISIIFEYHYLLIMNSLGWTSSGIPWIPALDVYLRYTTEDNNNCCGFKKNKTF